MEKCLSAVCVLVCFLCLDQWVMGAPVEEDFLAALHRLMKADKRPMKVELEAAARRIEALEGESRENLVPVVNRVRCQAQQRHGESMRVDDFLMKPSYTSEWTMMRSNDAVLSDILIDHPLGSVPLLIDVQVKAINGSNEDWIFPGCGAIQSDDDTGEKYGGVVFLYNDRQVRLIAPKKYNNAPVGSIIYTGSDGGKWLGTSAQSSQVAMVRVRMWAQDRLPAPDFQSDWIGLDIYDATRSFHEVEHGFGKYPDVVSVQVRAGDWYSVGVGSAMSLLGSTNYNGGGVLHGYDRNHVRIWTASLQPLAQEYTGYLFGLPDGWGANYWPYATIGQVRVLAWKKLVTTGSPSLIVKSPSPSENTVCLSGVDSPKPASECADQELQEIDIDTDIVALSVEVLSGPNRGFRFAGAGAGQSVRSPYGGVLYGYNRDGRVRFWLPVPNKSGYMVNVNQPYGNEMYLRASNDAVLAVTALKAVC